MTFYYKGLLTSHRDWVTGLVAGDGGELSLFSCSRDKSLILWREGTMRAVGRAGSGVDGPPRKRRKRKAKGSKKIDKAECLECPNEEGHRADVAHFKHCSIPVEGNNDTESSGITADHSVQSRALNAPASLASSASGLSLAPSITVASSGYVAPRVPRSDTSSLVAFGTMSRSGASLHSEAPLLPALIMTPRRQYLGHGNFISDLCLISVGEHQFLLSCSWDGSVRAWDPADSRCIHKLMVHDERHNSVALFSLSSAPDGSLCLAGGEDGSMTLIAITASTRAGSDNITSPPVPAIQLRQQAQVRGAHEGWISCLRLGRVPIFLAGDDRGDSSNAEPRLGYDALSVGLDGRALLWRCFSTSISRVGALMNGQATASADAVPLLSADVSPDGSLWAVGARDGRISLWAAGPRAGSGEAPLLHFTLHSPISSLSFCPCRFWLAAGGEGGAAVIDIGSAAGAGPATETYLTHLYPEVPGSRARVPRVTSLCWGPQCLYIGYADNTIRIWGHA